MKTLILTAYLGAVLFCGAVIDPLLGAFAALPGIAFLMVKEGC